MSEQKVTFCRICEAHCGMLATVEDGRVTKLRPDPDHPLSKGYACPKGIAMTEVQNDPDRVLQPLRRRPDGEFEPVSWEQAMADITTRLKRIHDERGAEGIAWYMGNPGAFSYSHTLWVKGFLDAIGSPHYYTAGSQDVNNRFAASALLYGTPLVVPIPDLARTRFLFMLGANPLVSHGSVLTAPRVRDQLHEVVDRGGRVVVVDPRRTETARQFEHVPIVPDTDAWLLLAMLHTIFGEALADRGFLDEHADGAGALELLARPHGPEQAESRTGIAADHIRGLARDFAAADGAAAYGRTGSCLGRFGTLVSFLLDALNAVTGNLDRPGGAVFGRPPVALDDLGERFGLATYGKVRSRFGGFPDVLGNLPASLLPREIETPGVRQIRALFVSAGNPVLSVPDGDALERAMEGLELCVSLDFYVNETNRHADYVLPAATWLERDDVPLAFLGFYTTPFIQQTDAVVPPAGEAREEWEVIDELARALGVVASSIAPLRLLGRLGIRFSPQRLLDLLLRTGPGRLSMNTLRRHPHGLVLDEHIATGVLERKVRHRGSRLALAPPEIAAEVERLAGANGHDPSYPLRLIGLRELRSHNSWMHNAPLLMRGGRSHALRVNPGDAAEHGLEDGGEARISSKSGAVVVPVKVTDEMIAGTVALPHGWGHRGGWRLANRHAGVNVNLLASAEPEDLEPLAGMAFLNGIPVRVEPVAPGPAAAVEADAVQTPSAV
ncbi:MAG: molybdopterin-dependent oxidoreductase [Thermoleophilaceae bacterium]